MIPKTPRVSGEVVAPPSQEMLLEGRSSGRSGRKKRLDQGRSGVRGKTELVFSKPVLYAKCCVIDYVLL